MHFFPYGSPSKEALVNNVFIDIAPRWLFVINTVICSQSAIIPTLPRIIDDVVSSLETTSPVLLPYLVDNYYGAFIFFKNRPGLPTSILVIDGFQKGREFPPVMQQLLDLLTTQLPMWGAPVIKKIWGLLEVPHEFTYEANRFVLFTTRLEQLFGYLDQARREGKSFDDLIHRPDIVSVVYNRLLKRVTMSVLAVNVHFQAPIAQAVDTSWYDDPKLNKLMTLTWRNLYDQNPAKAQRVAIFPVQPLNVYSNVLANIAALPNLQSTFLYTNDPLPYEIPKFADHLAKKPLDFDLIIFPVIVAAENREFEKLNQPVVGQICNHYSLVILRKLPDGRYEFYYQCPLGESSFYSHNKELAWQQFFKFFHPIVLVKKETKMTTQQNNSYDCGVWLVRNVEHALTSNWDDVFGSMWPQDLDIASARELHNALVISLG